MQSGTAIVPTLTAATSTTSLWTAVRRSRQKKFHRYFTQIPAEEQLLNYYSCALVTDILLQGHLYISANHFAFHSNVFGYVTKVLISTGSVIEIRKQKTVKIIPNAVAITTDQESYVFCSFFARDSTFRLLKEVWEASKDRKLLGDVRPSNENQFRSSESLLTDESEASLEENDSCICESETDRNSISSTCTKTDEFSTSNLRQVAITRMRSAMRSVRLWDGLRCNMIIAILVVLLAVLYVSAAVMMMRIDRLQTKYPNHPLESSEQLIKNLLSQFLNSNLDQIVKVRERMQMLSREFLSRVEDAENAENLPVSDGVIDLDDVTS